MDTRIVRTILVVLFSSVQICETRKPNIIFMIADDLGWADVSWNNPKIISPNLEELYHKSVKLENYYVLHVCTPSRAAFLTGIYPFHLGLQHRVIKPSQPSYLPIEIDTLPERLKKLGYKTALIGKWHLGFCDWKVTPTYRGFDQFYGTYLGGADHFNHTRTYKELSALDFRQNKKIVRDQKGVYSTHSNTRWAVEYISEHDGEAPFYLQIAYRNVHAPLQVPKEYFNMYKDRYNGDRRTKASMVSSLDEGVGEVMRALREKDIMDDTIIVFTTDNGGPVQAGGRNFPYRGSKGTLFEGGTKAIGFIYSSELKRGKFEGLFHAVDWFPTLLRAAGQNSEDLPLDGIDQWENLKDNKPVREEFVYNIDEIDGIAALRSGKFKILVGRPIGYTAWYDDNIDRNQIKKVRSLWNKPKRFPRPTNYNIMLFDLEEDPYEKKDLSAELPFKVQELYRKLIEYKDTLIEAFVPDSVEDSRPIRDHVWTPGWCHAVRRL